MKNITLRKPRPIDGAAINRLVSECPPLDPNSLYCNLLQASHFGGTAVVADLDGELVGFVTGYRIPERPSTLFVWQVAVSTAARGEGLGRRMLDALVDRLTPDGVVYLETTVTPDNAASAAMFEGFAKTHDASLAKSVMFSREEHFEGRHDDEMLLRIGPFPGLPAAHETTTEEIRNTRP